MKTIMAATVGIAGFMAMSDVVFKEDFAQRSVDPSMTKRMATHWSSCEYVCGNGTVNPLAYSYTYGKYRYSPELPYSDVSQIQDGWIMGGIAGQNWVPGFFATTNSPSELPGDTDRPFAALSIGGGANYYESRVMQSIGNSFSNGTVRYTIDFRAPRRWYRKGDGGCRLYRCCRHQLCRHGQRPCGCGEGRGELHGGRRGSEQRESGRLERHNVCRTGWLDGRWCDIGYVRRRDAGDGRLSDAGDGRPGRRFDGGDGRYDGA